MKNQTVFTIALLFIIGIGILFAINITSILKGKETDEPYLKYNQMKGVAVQHNTLLYTLSFEQQTQFAALMNRSVRVVGVKPDKHEKPKIEKIIVYQFDHSDVIITPIAYLNGNLVYSAPAWNADNYLMELSDGEMQKLLDQTYDQ